ncbi:MAG: GxxExxY protein [candidate division WOR-3 bacterium]
MEELMEKIKELAQKVYKELGPFGFIEETEYEAALAYEFRKNGLKYLEQLQVDIMYEDQIVKEGKVDFIVFDEKEENGIIVELKAITEIYDKFLDQPIKYYEAIKSEKSSFPRFLANKIKKIVVLKWEINRKGKKLPPLFEKDGISSPPDLKKIGEKYKNIIKIITIDAREDTKKSKKKEEKEEEED